MNELTPEMQKNIRKNWQVGDWVEVFSKSRDQWFRAKIIEIYDDEDGEWLAVVVENTMIKEVQRFNPDVRPIVNLNDDDSESDYSDSDVGTSSSGFSSDLNSSDDSDDEEKSHRSKKKALKKRSKHHEIVLIFVERAGTDLCNGKYLYVTTSEDGYPQFAKVDEHSMKIIQNEDEQQWEFRYKNKTYYYAENDEEFPPSVGWNKTRAGDLPNPGVRLDSIKKVEKGDNNFPDDPYKFSPFIRMKCDFVNVVEEPLGFDLKIIQIHSTFVAVKSVKPDTQAANFGIQEGDILLNAGEDDLSRMKSVDEVSQTIAETIAVLRTTSQENQNISITFAREKSVFKVAIVRRAGAKCVNGKYAIEGQENGALRYSLNSNPEYKLLRMYVSEEDGESIWIIRHIAPKMRKFKFSSGAKKHSKQKSIKHGSAHNNNGDAMEVAANSSTERTGGGGGSEDDEDDDEHKDYYIVLAGATVELPPECGWDAVEPHGQLPGPGVVYHDVNLTPPSRPDITRCQPNPNAVQLHWICDETNRKPKVCPHMEVWYEVEMRHWIPVVANNKETFETRIWQTNESPFVANKLVNGDEYQFVVRSANHIASNSSIVSLRITPLQLPPKPKITNLTGKCGELYVHFHCANAKDREVQAKFEIIVDPPLDESSQDYPIKEHRLLVESDNKPVRLRNLTNGQTYQIIVASVNTVGVTYSEPENAYPSIEPPQPLLTRVEAGNREIIVYFKCGGYDKPDCKAWFEMELDPPPPQLLADRVDNEDEDGNPMTDGDDSKEDGSTDRRAMLSRKKSKIRSRLARKSRWRRQTMSQRLMSPIAKMATSGRNIIGGGGGLNAGSDLSIDENSNTDEQKTMMPFNEEEADDFIPYFRRVTRHFGSPVKIAPVVNGVPYIVRVKAVTLSGSKITAFSEAIIPKGPPPMPKITKLVPLQSAVSVHFECNDYATPEYEAKFEVESHPNSSTQKCKSTPCDFPGLVNGWNYKFQVRAYNKEGKSKWSDRSAGATPLRIPPLPVELRTVPFDREITVYWVCEELKTPEYSGWYEVESDPPTFTMVVTRQQARFKRLTNGKKYTFKVSAVNQVGKETSEPSEPCMPDDRISKKEYARLKKAIACEVRELVIQKRKEAVRLDAQNKLINIKHRTKKVKLADSKKEREKMAKVMDRQRRKKKAENAREQKKVLEREMRRQRMDEQRNKVLMNKRRISFLHRQQLGKQFENKIRVKNPNKMSSMSVFGKMQNMRNKKKKRSNKSVKFSNNSGGSVQASVKSSSNNGGGAAAAGTGTPLLPKSEITQLQNEMKAVNKKNKNSSRKSKAKNGMNPPKMKKNASTSSSSSSGSSSSSKSTNKSSNKKKAKRKKSNNKTTPK